MMKSAVAPFLPNFRNISPDFLPGRPIQAVLLPIFDPITHSLPASQRVKRPKMTNAQVGTFNPHQISQVSAGGIKKPTLGDFRRKSAVKNCFPETRKVRIISAQAWFFMLFAHFGFV